MRKALALLLCLSFAADASEAAKRVQAHCTIQDYNSACREGKEALAANPKDQALWRAYIAALGDAGREAEMLQAYRQFAKKDRQLLEVMAWSILKQGSKSPAPLTRIYTLVASFYAQDIRGVNILYQHTSDRSALFRWVTVQLVSQLRDTKLQHAMLQLLKEERNPKVRLEVIQAIGKMRIKEAKPELLAVVESRHTTAEEKALAIQSMALMFEEASREEISRLVRSDRAALRALACQLVIHLDQKKDADLLTPLVNDTHSEVRVAAVTALGLLEVPISKTSDPNDSVAIHIAWALTRQGSPDGLVAFTRLLQHTDRKTRIESAAALASCGKFGVELMKKNLHDKETLVSMNIALGLIGQRESLEEATKVLAEGLNTVKDRLMWSEEPAYKALVPSDVTHQAMIPQYPEAINQSTRLEILNVLAVLHYPNIQELMKHFLEQRVWGVSGMASALLLTEGDEAALAVVEKLLEDPDARIRTQAALVLSLWGRSPKAIATLENSYIGASRDLKEKIIEGIGRIGDETSIPFLVDRLEEPHQTLRVLGAMALLQCLYH